MLEALKDNDLSNKPVVGDQTLLTQMNTNDCINLKIRLTIFNVPEQNDFQTHGQHISCGAQNNLVMVDL